MPSSKEIASELWLHVNSPETLDKIVGDQIAKFESEARLDELSDYQNERKKIDATVDRYLSSPQFESYRQTFLEIDDIDSPELEQAVNKMTRELKYGVTETGRDAIAKDIESSVRALDRTIEHNVDHDQKEQSH